MTEPQGLVVLGAGGHAKVVLAALLEANAPVAAVLDDDPALHGSEILGLRVRGPIAGTPEEGRSAILAIGDNATRRRLASELAYDWSTVVHAAAYVHASVQLGAGTFVAAGAVIQPDTVVGAHAIINTGAVIDHDCVVGSFCHLAPGAHLAGGVQLGDGVLLGLGAGAVPGVSIGGWAVLGAGAMAVSDLPARATAVGVPARWLDDG